jgi:predicted cupin superfamily sugar epimerase
MAEFGTEKLRDVLTTDAATELQISGHTNGGLYALIIVIARLLEPTGHAKDWKDSIYSLLEKFSFRRYHKVYNTPLDWHKHPIWK